MGLEPTTQGKFDEFQFGKLSFAFGETADLTICKLAGCAVAAYKAAALPLSYLSMTNLFFLLSR